MFHIEDLPFDHIQLSAGMSYKLTIQFEPGTCAEVIESSVILDIVGRDEKIVVPLLAQASHSEIDVCNGIDFGFVSHGQKHTQTVSIKNYGKLQ